MSLDWGRRPEGPKPRRRHRVAPRRAASGEHNRVFLSRRKKSSSAARQTQLSWEHLSGPSLQGPLSLKIKQDVRWRRGGAARETSAGQKEEPNLLGARPEHRTGFHWFHRGGLLPGSSLPLPVQNGPGRWGIALHRISPDKAVHVLHPGKMQNAKLEVRKT